MGTKNRRKKENKEKQTKEKNSALETLTLSEPLHSLLVFNRILFAFSLLYDVFFLVDLIWAFFCGSCFSHSEMITLGLLLPVNLLSTAAIACFLLAVSRQKNKVVNESYSYSGLIGLYFLLNGLALSLEVIGFVVLHLFGEFHWSSLASAVFVLFYEVSFISGNLLVYRLVWLHASYHNQVDFNLSKSREQSSPSTADDSTKDKSPQTEQQTAAIIANIRLLTDSMAASGKQSATAMEHFVESMRLDLPGRLPSLCPSSSNNSTGSSKSPGSHPKSTPSSTTTTTE